MSPTSDAALALAEGPLASSKTSVRATVAPDRRKIIARAFRFDAYAAETNRPGPTALAGRTARSC
jgi:hypothetical protein